MKVRSTCLLLLIPLALAKPSWQNHLTHQSITEEYLLRALADTGASRSIILEAYTSAPFIKTYHSNKTTWSTIGDKFTTAKTGVCL
jgi:hypothetical protein